jgi:uncharacterized damage-inducible protein DinB
MTVADLQTLLDYGYWANRKLFAVVERLTPEQFTRTLDGKHGCVRNTLVHVLSAEWGWLERCGGLKRGAPLDPANFPTPQSLVEPWANVESHLRQFLSKLRDEDLQRNVEFVMGNAEKRSMPLGELLSHAANHGVHHRGQVSLLLRLLGHDPENFDLFIYFAQRKPG